MKAKFIVILLVTILVCPFSSYSQKRPAHTKKTLSHDNSRVAKHKKSKKKKLSGAKAKLHLGAQVAIKSAPDTTYLDPELELNPDLYDGEVVYRRDTSNNFPCNKEYHFWANSVVDPYKTDLNLMKDTSIIDMEGYYHPIMGKINSDFGFRRYRYHYGVDVNLHTGDTIRAAFDGMIRISTRGRFFGNYIVIRHYNKLETVYGHLSKLLVAQNQHVKAGDVIGLGGSTGRSTGPHLHFEFRYLGRPINPNEMVDYAQGIVKHDEFIVSGNTFAYYDEKSHIKFHRVRRGETLSHIARRYKVPTSHICKINRMGKSKHVRVGQRIRIS